MTIPEFIAPMLLTDGGGEAFYDENFAFEIKFDGVRMLAFIEGDPSASLRMTENPFKMTENPFRMTSGRNNGANGVRLINRKGNYRTAVYPEIAAALKGFPSGTVLDGELTALNSEGRPRFYNILKRDPIANPSPLLIKRVPVVYMVFDILYFEGRDLTAKGEAADYEARRKILQSLSATPRSPLLTLNRIRLADNFPDGKILFEAVTAEKLEGVVAKRRDSLYRPGTRSGDWLKIKRADWETETRRDRQISE